MWVITCYRNFVTPENIFIFQKEPYIFITNDYWLPGIVLPRDISLDEVIFILTRFVPGFADNYMYVRALPLQFRTWAFFEDKEN